MRTTNHLSRRVRRRAFGSVTGFLAWIGSFWLAGAATASEPAVGGQALFWDATVTSAALLDLPESLVEEPPPAPEPVETELSEPLAELQRLLEQPVVVSGPPPATLTEVATELAAVLPPGYVVAPVDRATPAAVTRIDYEEIWYSGARSLNELFDIFVPDAQVIRHHAQPPHLGFRGIISDKDDKYLLRVNGRVMNNRSQLGSLSEHCLPMLGDIHHIDVVRGPGSTTYGPGAISGVVNVVTYNGLTFQGTDATVRQGFLEYFTAAEVRHGVKLSDDSGLFLYYGYADYPGAPQEYSPYVIGRSFTALDGVPVVAGDPVAFDVPNDHRTYRSTGRHKVHAQYTKGNFDAWLRFTRSGEQEVFRRDFVTSPPLGTIPAGTSFDDLSTEQVGYQQLTAFMGYRLEASENLNIDLALSYDTFDLERLTREVPSGYIAHREDEWFGRILAKWDPFERHALAFGFEYFHEDFGLDSPGFPYRPAYTPRLRNNTRPWGTDTYSLLGEYQWRITDQWTAFLSGRADKHTYTDWLISPRAAIVWMPTEQDTLKLIAAKAVRRVEDDVLRAAVLDDLNSVDAEPLKSLELRYERRPNEARSWGLSAFYEDTETVAFARAVGESVGSSQVLGDFQIWGLEFETSYRTDRTRFVASHSYSDLVDGHLNNPAGIVQGVSAYPYNDLFADDPFGRHLANWSPHLTKLYLVREFDCCWSASGSLRIYWDFPGARDLTEYNNYLLASTGAPSAGLGLSDPGYDKAFGGNYYLDLGLERKIRDRSAVRLDLYNVLGWFDQDLNKRNYLNRLSEYRAEAAAVALTARLEY